MSGVIKKIKNRHNKQRGRDDSGNYTKKSPEEVLEDWRKYLEHWRWYPDHFIDFISTKDSKIQLYFYQRIFLRVFFRYRKVFLTATRGTAKSWTEILAMYLQCMFYPGISKFICAPGKEQAAKISQENLDAIWEFFPILEGELKYKSFQNDYTRLVFKNGSRFDVVQVKNSQKGGRRHGGAIEEIADPQFDGDKLHEVVIPLMANNRIATCKGVDPDEVHKQEWYITTAGTRQSFAFKKMQEVLSDMAQGKSAFAIGNGYELPAMHGQLDIDFVNEQKESPTYNPLAFQREYESIWTGSSNDSLVSLDDLNKCRVLSDPEDKAVDKDAEYVLTYDVARAEGSVNAQSALVVIKIKDKGDGTYTKHVVNIYSFEGTHFLEQAQFLKKKVNDFNARILCVDANGLGVGLVDFLVTEIDKNPAYEVVNDDRYDRYKTATSIPMLFNIKSSQKGMKAGDIHNVFASEISNQRVKLLRPASSIKAQHFDEGDMTSERYAKIAKPFAMTDLLHDEVMNLEYRQSGNDTGIKQVSAAVNKDKFSALEYGLYWIYLQEKQNRVKQVTVEVDYTRIFDVFKSVNVRGR